MSDQQIVDHLRHALASADPMWVSQPSRLRRALVDELGSGGHRYRSEIHQLVVAADENVPARLRRAGWSPDVRDELASALIAARGWTQAAATWAVSTWAAALELDDTAVPRSARSQHAESVFATTPATDLSIPAATDLATDIADATDSAAPRSSAAADPTHADRSDPGTER
jgi:hypothetical protein